MKKIDGRGLKTWIAEGKPMLLLDVREPSELRTPPGALLDSLGGILRAVGFEVADGAHIRLREH